MWQRRESGVSNVEKERSELSFTYLTTLADHNLKLRPRKVPHDLLDRTPSRLYGIHGLHGIHDLYGIHHRKETPASLAVTLCDHFIAYPRKNPIHTSKERPTPKYPAQSSVNCTTEPDPFPLGHQSLGTTGAKHP